MKRYVCCFLVAVVGIAAAGCTTPQGYPDNTASGALAGGATGAIIGSMTHNPGSGALVGGAVGALLGGLIGHGLDQAQEAQLRAQAPETLQRVQEGQPLAVADVQALAKAGVSDELIISEIRNSRTVYHLDTAQIIDLKNAGVSERIIDFMINTPAQAQSAQVAGIVGAPPPAPVYQPVVVAPGPYYNWIPGQWLWIGARWVWYPGYWYLPPYYHRHWHHW